MPKELSGGVHCVRGLLLILNILFVVLGLVLIGIGVYVKVSNNFLSILEKFTDFDGFDARSLGYLAVVMIGGGAVTVVISLCGCLGTLRNSRCFLNMYAAILAILMIIELVGFIMAFAYKSKLTEVYETALFKVLNNSLANNNTKILNAFTELENSMQCCGVHNISDYAPYHRNSSSDGCKNNWSKGCADAIIDLLSKNLPAIGITLGVLLLLELFAFVGAVALGVAIKHSPDDCYSSNPGEVIKNIVPRRHNYY